MSNSRFKNYWNQKASSTNTYKVTVSYGGKSFVAEVSADSSDAAERQVFNNLQVLAK